MAIDSILDYFRSYNKENFGVFACQGQEPSEEDIAAFEGECGFRLPEEFREFTMSPLGGLYMEAREEVWPRAQAFDIGPFWSFLYAVKVFGIAQDIPGWLDIREQYREMSEMGYPHLVPFLQVQGNADFYCFDAEGRTLRWLHDEPDEPEVVDESFAELVMREIHELEERTEWKRQGKDRANGSA